MLRWQSENSEKTHKFELTISQIPNARPENNHQSVRSKLNSDSLERITASIVDKNSKNSR